MDALAPPPEVSVPVSKSCGQCGVDVSPRWHDVDVCVLASIRDNGGMEIDDEEEQDVKPEQSSTSVRLCHLCWYQSQDE